MEKKFVILVLAVCLAITVGTGGSAASRSEGEKISKPLGFGEDSDVFVIPRGSTIVQLLGGVTEIYDSNNKLWLKISDEKVELISTPRGFKKATKVFQVPSGSFITSGSEGVTEVYGPEGDLILKVVEKDETQRAPDFDG